MKRPHEIFEEAEREKEAEELKQILEKPQLTPEEIWSIYPANFYKWRKKFDYPRILSHFKKKLTRFEAWQEEFEFTDDMLMDFGISNCINPNPSKDKQKFIIERTWENSISRHISYQNIDGKYYNLGPNYVNHKVIKTFVGYIDWCNSKGIAILPERRNNDLLWLHSKSGVNSPYVTVEILDGLKLLKVGGLEVIPDAYGLIKPKYFEFVNADYLKLSGRLATSGQELIFENSFIDNFICEDLDLGLVQFRSCSLRDLLIANSDIQQWQFTECGVNGKAYNSDLKMITSVGGSFQIDFKDCTFYEVEARASSLQNVAYENTYRTFKKVYSDQGDDKKAIEYFLLEKDMERQRLRLQIFNYQPRGLFKETKKQKFINQAKHIFFTSLKYVSSWINNRYWGYGRKPIRIVTNSLVFIFLFSLLYYFAQASMNMPSHQSNMTFFDSLYYSTVTFTTLGYGDFTPLGFLRIFASVEAFLGGISLGFLVAGFSNFKY